MAELTKENEQIIRDSIEKYFLYQQSPCNMEIYEATSAVKSLYNRDKWKLIDKAMWVAQQYRTTGMTVDNTILGVFEYFNERLQEKSLSTIVG